MVLTQATAHPPSEPDHGVNDTTFYTLWAGDEDASNRTALEERVGESPSAMQELAAGSDIPLNDPPAAVEQWNRGDHGDFPPTGASQSIAPPHATLTDGRFVADAYAAVFAVQPSTRARLTETDVDDPRTGGHPRYVAPNGSLLGTVDYRVDLPPDDTTGDRRVRWSIHEHSVTATRLLVDGQLETNASGSHTPRLPYTALDTYVGSEHTLAIEADISVTLRKEVRRCTAHDPKSGACTNWAVQVTYPSESVTVRDTVDVSVYTLTVSGFRTRYPNGDRGLIVYKDRPWLGYTTPAGEVRGVWRFYAARDTRWDTLVTHTDSGTSESHSPMHPLQVHAYPIETGPTPNPRRNVTVVAAYGREQAPPTLPPTVNLDVLAEPYTASYGIATRIQTTEDNLSSVTAHGLVRGVETVPRSEDFIEVPYRRSNLTLTVQNASAERVTVRATLREVETGDPIATDGREGYLVVEGTRVNTSTDGTATVTVQTNGSGVAGRYEPARWWREPTAYTGDSDAVYAGRTALHLLSVLYQAAIPVGILLIAVFLTDRATGWDVWPPWGRR